MRFSNYYFIHSEDPCVVEETNICMCGEDVFHIFVICLSNIHDLKVFWLIIFHSIIYLYFEPSFLIINVYKISAGYILTFGCETAAKSLMFISFNISLKT